MRIGEDPDLSMTIWENGYQTAFFDDIGVYHKRRTDLGKFSNKCINLAVRPILNQRHPDYVKPTFGFLLCFIGLCCRNFRIFSLQKGFVLACYGFLYFGHFSTCFVFD